MRSTLFNIAFVTSTAVIALTGYIASFLASAKTISKWLRFWGNHTQWLAKTILGATIEIRGTEHLPAGQPHLIAAKHQSELDVLVTASLYPDMSTVAMKTLEKHRFSDA